MGLHPQQDMRMNKAVWISYWVRISLPFYRRAQSQLEEQNFKYYSTLVLLQNISELKQNKRICFNRIHFFQSLVLTFFLNIKSINISKFWDIDGNSEKWLTLFNFQNMNLKNYSSYPSLMS